MVTGLDRNQDSPIDAALSPGGCTNGNASSHYYTLETVLCHMCMKLGKK
jgi:hypothetical protein